MLVELALEGYLSGRSAALSELHQAAARNLHYAVELLLKACLLKGGDPLEDFLERDKSANRPHGRHRHHVLGKLWDNIKAQRAQPANDLQRYDQVIADLEPMEPLRYPDPVLKAGMFYEMSWTRGYRPDPKIIDENKRLGRTEPRYFFSVGDVDELVAALVELASYNIVVIKQRVAMLSDHARTALMANNESPTKAWASPG
jgi:hypothetical protein